MSEYSPTGLPRLRTSRNISQSGIVLPRPIKTDTVILQSPKALGLSPQPFTIFSGGQIQPFPISAGIISDVSEATVNVPQDAVYVQFRCMKGDEAWVSFSSVGLQPADYLINRPYNLPPQTASGYNEPFPIEYSNYAIYLDENSRELFDCTQSQIVVLQAGTFYATVNILWFAGPNET